MVIQKEMIKSVQDSTNKKLVKALSYNQLQNAKVKQLVKKAESAIDAINNSKVMERLQQNVLDTTYRFINKKPAQLNQDEKELVMIFFGDTQFYHSNPVKQKMEEMPYISILA